MKKFTKRIPEVFLFLFSFVIVFAFVVSNKKQKNADKEVINLTDSIKKANFEKQYMVNLIDLGMKENNKIFSLTNINIYEIKDDKYLYPKTITPLLDGAKKTLVIRYTEFGCNSCADVVFNLIKKFKIDEQYSILILTDFTKYEYYLKWKKIAEINYPVYRVKKGELPFEINKLNASYLFTINEFMIMNDFFIPNSSFPSFTKQYISSIGS